MNGYERRNPVSSPVGLASMEEERSVQRLCLLGENLGLIVVKEDQVMFQDHFIFYYCLRHYMTQPFDFKLFRELTDFTFEQDYRPSDYILIWRIWSHSDTTLLSKIVDLLKKGSTAHIRADAAKVLGMTGNPFAVDPLIKALKSKTAILRAEAAEALSKLNDPRIVDTFLNCLDDEVIRNTALPTLGRSKDERAIPPLVKFSQAEKSSTRISAIIGLGYSENERAIKPLISILENQAEDSLVRSQAAWSLGKLKRAAVSEPLINALQDPNVYVRHAAIRALGEVGNPKAVEFLIPLLKDPNVEIRWVATEALGKIGDARVLFSLREVEQQDTGVAYSIAVRTVASQSIREILTKTQILKTHRQQT